MPIKKYLILILAPVIVLLLLLITLYTQYTARHTANELAGAIAKGIAEKEATEIQTLVAQTRGATEALAAIFSRMKHDGILSRETVKVYLGAVLSAEKAFVGMSSCWADIDGNNAASKDTENGNSQGMLGAYWSRDSSGKLQYDQLQNFDKEMYYTGPMQTKKSILTPPYEETAGGGSVMMVTMSSPVFDGSKTLGVVTADISLTSLSEILGKVRPYGVGYGYIVSNDGIILAHPKQELIGRSVLELPSAEREKIHADLASKQEFTHKGVSIIDGKATTTSFFAFKLSGSDAPWFFAIAVPTEAVMAESTRQLWFTLALCIVGIVLSVGSIFLVANSLSKSMGSMVLYAGEVANGNYGNDVPTKGFCRELLQLHAAIGNMISSLLASTTAANKSKAEAEQGLLQAKEAMSQADEARSRAEEGRGVILRAAGDVENVTARLTASVAQLSEQMSRLVHHSQLQGDLVTTTASAMTQMNSTVLDMASNSGSAAQGSDSARKSAEEGAAIVADSISAIDMVHANAESLHKEMLALGKQADGISNIITVINDIADQTNLLALNAAIEAARAGDYGKGFAVVADEVRKLAEKTVTATAEVRNAISAIQQRTEQSGSALVLTMENLKKSSGFVRNSGEALHSIVHETHATAEQIERIATAVEEQSSTSQHINEALKRIDEASRDVNDISQDAGRAVKDLAEQARELNNLVAALRKG